MCFQIIEDKAILQGLDAVFLCRCVSRFARMKSTFQNFFARYLNRSSLKWFYVGLGIKRWLLLLVVGVTTGGPHAFTGVMCSILFRTLGPLGLGAIWQVTHPEWPVQNLIEIHVPLFLVSLTVETILVVDIVSNSSSSSSAHFSGKDR